MCFLVYGGFGLILCVVDGLNFNCLGYCCGCWVLDLFGWVMISCFDVWFGLICIFVFVDFYEFEYLVGFLFCWLLLWILGGFSFELVYLVLGLVG